MAVFGKSCWNVDTRKMLRSVLKKFFFGFIEALASKGILNTLKKRNYISHGVRWTCCFHFRYMTNEIAHFLSLQSLFLQKLLSWMYLQFGEYFLWVWASEANFLAVFSKRVRRFQENFNIFWGKQELAKLAVFVSILGENPTVLKLVVDNVNLSLCDLRDLSAWLLLRKILVSFSYHSWVKCYLKYYRYCFFLIMMCKIYFLLVLSKRWIWREY